MSMTIKAAQEALPRWALALLLALMTLLAACSDSPPAQPTISVQPTDTSAVAGTAAILSVSASGPDIGYQWQLSTDAGSTWANVAGATGASYTTPVTSSGDNGKRYRVVISAAGISVNSSAVTLTVTAAVVAPGITVAPPSASVIAPAAAVFNVTATGTAVSYQWQRSTDNGGSWSNVSGATAASFDSGATDATMNGTRYRVIVSNSAGSVTSGVATLTVSAAPAAPAFSTQTTNQSVTAGSAAAFSVVASGTPTPTLQWQRSTDGGTTFANITGATDPTYNTGLTTLSQDGERYRVTASNGSGSTTSNAVRLTVNPAPQTPVITTQPAAQNVTAPATASFIATASGVPTPTWQWQLSTDSGGTWANINGATSATYTTPATVVGDSGKRYRAVATNGSGSATSQGALLTVTTAIASIVDGNVALFAVQKFQTLGQLWLTDGTASGTTLIKDFGAWTQTGWPMLMTKFNGRVYFSENDAATTTPTMWSTDGTGAGTVPFSVNGRTWTDPNDFTSCNGKFFFTATAVGNGATQTGLWTSDGTPAGSVFLKAGAFNGGVNSVDGSGVACAGNVFYIHSGPGSNVWRSDGTVAGTTNLRDVNGAGVGAGGWPWIVALGNSVYFAGADGKLWRSSANSSTAAPVSSLVLAPRSLTAGLTKLYMIADLPGGVRQLWVWDGTSLTAITSPLDSPAPILTVGDTAYFGAGVTVSTPDQLWASDGVTASAVTSQPFSTAFRVSTVLGGIAAYGNAVYFRGSTGTTGEELWSYDTITGTAVLVQDIVPGTTGSEPQYLRVVNGKLLFAALVSPNVLQLWSTSGAGAQLVKDLSPQGYANPVWK